MARNRNVPKKAAKKSEAGSTKTNVPYILNVKGRHMWRANPADPFIYISFSAKQFYSAFSTDKVANYLYHYAESGEVAPSVDLEEGVRAKYQDILTQEWIIKAKVPVRFLPDNTPIDEVKSKNVVFMLGKNIKMFSILTMPMTFPHVDWSEENVPAQYKITHFGKLTVASLTNKDINIMLHESFHTMIGGKHFKPYDRVDKPPYNMSMTCLDSVMAYQDSCPPVTAVEIREFPVSEFPMGVRRDDPRPEIQRKVAKMDRAFPTTLGTSDLEAAKVFTERWNVLNKEAAERAKAPEKSKATHSASKSKAKQKAAQAASKPTPEKDVHTFVKEHGELIRIPQFVGENGTFSDYRTGHASLPGGEEAEPSAGQYAVVAFTAACAIKLLSTIGASTFCLPWNRPQPVLDSELLQLLDHADKIKDYQNKHQQAEKVGTSFVDPEMLTDTKILLSRTLEFLENAIKTRSITRPIRDTIAKRMEQCKQRMEKVFNALIETLVAMDEFSSSPKMFINKCHL